MVAVSSVLLLPVRESILLVLGVPTSSPTDPFVTPLLPERGTGPLQPAAKRHKQNIADARPNELPPELSREYATSLPFQNAAELLAGAEHAARIRTILIAQLELQGLNHLVLDADSTELTFDLNRLASTNLMDPY